MTLGDLDAALRGLGQPTVSLALRPTGYDLHVSAIGRGWIALRGPSLSYLFDLAIDYLDRCEPLPEHASRYVLGCALEHTR